MNYFDFFLYSTIQGITEFFPVSSSAHLLFAEKLFGWKDTGIYYALAAHVGSLFAILFFFIKDSNLFREKFINYFAYSSHLIILILSIFPVIFFGIIISIFLKLNYANSILIIGLASIVGAFLLELSDRRKEVKKISSLTFRNAIFIGLFHSLALVPGMSRSGCVITASRFLRLSREESILYAVITGFPVLFLASLYGIYKAVIIETLYLNIFLIISFFSFLTTLISIRFLLRWAKYFSFRVFVIYRLFMGLALLSFVIY